MVSPADHCLPSASDPKTPPPIFSRSGTATVPKGPPFLEPTTPSPGFNAFAVSTRLIIVLYGQVRFFFFPLSNSFAVLRFLQIHPPLLLRIFFSFRKRDPFPFVEFLTGILVYRRLSFSGDWNWLSSTGESPVPSPLPRAVSRSFFPR